MSQLLKQEIAKIQDEGLKKKLNAKKGLTQAKALRSIKAWRNVRVFLRLALSVLTLGLVPLFYYLWAKKNNVYNNYVTIPIQQTQTAIDGINQLGKTPSENNDKAEEQSVELSANDSESHKNHQQSSSSSELAPPQDDKSKSRTQVNRNKKQDKASQEIKIPSASSSELVNLQDNKPKMGAQVVKHSSSSSTEIQSSEESRSPNKIAVDVNKTQSKHVEAVKRFKPEIMLLEAPGAVSHLQVPPQVQHNGLVTFKCSNGKDIYYAAYEMVRDNIKTLSSCPTEGGIVAYYSTNNSVIQLELHSDFISYRSYKKADWRTAKFAVIPHFFIPLFIKMNSTGDIVEAVSIYDHKKNAIAFNHYKNGVSETEEITFFEPGIAATISCASVNKNLIFVGCSNGKIYRVEMGDDFTVSSVNSISFTDQPILSIAINYSGTSLIILLSDGSLHYYENGKHLVLDIDIPSPQVTSIGFRNEDLLIATQNSVLVAKDVGPKQDYLSHVAKNAKYMTVAYPENTVQKRISISGQVIAIIMSDDLHDVKPYKICKVDQEKNCLYLMFQMGLGFSYHLLEPFYTSSGYLAFYYIDNLNKEIQFYSQAGELLGSVPKFTYKWGSNIVIENFNIECGLGSKILMEGSFIVTEDGQATRYTFTEATCTTESVPIPAAAYSKVLSTPKKPKENLTQLVKSTPAVNTVADLSPVNTVEYKPAEIGEGERDYDFIWTATTDSAEHLGCKRITYPDGTIQYEIGLWPEKFDQVGKLPVHTLFLTKDENAKNWTPILSKENQWNFFSYTNKSLVVYDDAGKQILQKDIDNTDKKLIPVEVSTTKDGSTNLTLIDIYKSNHLLLLNVNRKVLFEVKAANITTAFYDTENQHLYFATKHQTLYRVNIATQEQKVIDLKNLPPEIKKMAITKIVLNEDRSLICLRFGEQVLRTYLVDFNNNEAKNVGYVEIENADIFDMQFTNNDVLIRSVTTIGYHEAVNILPKSISNRF